MTEEKQVEAEDLMSEGGDGQREQGSIEGEIVADDAMIDEGTADEVTDAASVAQAEAEEAAVEEDAALSEEAALIAQLQAELTEAQAEALAHMDKLQRLAAEFQNSKRRQERQLSDAIQRASSHLVERLLPVLDDFDLAFGNVPEDVSAEDDAWVGGFRQIQEKLSAILADQGLTAIAPDGAFDPNLHEAITSEPSEDVDSGFIIETLRVGYEFKGRVLRPAMVRVAS